MSFISFSVHSRQAVSLLCPQPYPCSVKTLVQKFDLPIVEIIFVNRLNFHQNIMHVIYNTRP